MFDGGGGGGGGRRKQAADLQLAAQRELQNLYTQLAGDTRRLAGNPSPTFQFNQAAGGPQNSKAFLDSIAPNAERNAMLQIAQLLNPNATSNGVENQGRASDLRRQERREDIASYGELAGVLLADLGTGSTGTGA